MLANYAAIIALLLAYLAAHTPPKTIGYLALFGLAYPFALLFNLLFIVYWYFKKRRNMLFSFIAIVAGVTHGSDFFQVNLFRGKPTGENTIKVMTYNVKLFGVYDGANGKQNRKNIFELLEKEQPDVVCFQEFYYSNKHGEYETRDTLVKFLSAKYYHERFTHAMNGRQYFGVAMFSRYPIINKGYIPFETDVNNFCIYADLKVGDDTIRVYDAHLASIRFQKEDYQLMDENAGNEELDKGGKRIMKRLKSGFVRRQEQVGRIVANVKDVKYPVILCGDFNDPPVSYCYEQLTDQLSDSFWEAGRGIGNTYIGVFPSFRIDYILHSKEFRAVEHRTLPEEYSDHHAVTALLEY